MDSHELRNALRKLMNVPLVQPSDYKLAQWGAKVVFAPMKTPFDSVYNWLRGKCGVPAWVPAHIATIYAVGLVKLAKAIADSSKGAGAGSRQAAASRQDGRNAKRGRRTA